MVNNNRKDDKGRKLHTGEQQRKDGIYLYRYTDVAGKRQTVYAGDLPELRIKEKQIQKDLDDNLLTDVSVKKMTLNTLFDRYMSMKSLTEATKFNHQRLWNNHVKDEIGNIKVIQLRPSHIRGFYKKLSEQNYSKSTIKLLHTMIFPALEMAVDDDIIRKNPAKNAMASEFGREAKEKEILTVEQQEKLFQFLASSNVYNVYIPMFTVLLEIGLRCGELIGLTWKDVSFTDKTLSVNHQLIYKNYGDGCKFHISSTKTQAGIRNIPLTEKVIKAFTEQKKLNFALGRCCEEEIDSYSDFIFIAKTGRPYMPSAVNSVIYNVIKAYNKEESENAEKEQREPVLIPKVSVHCFRHTACTNMARSEMNIKVVQYLMGHSDSSMTLDVYNHLNNESDVREEVYKCEKNVI